MDKGRRKAREIRARLPMASKHALSGTRVIKHPSRRIGWLNGVDCGGTSGGTVTRSHGDWQPSLWVRGRDWKRLSITMHQKLEGRMSPWSLYSRVASSPSGTSGPRAINLGTGMASRSWQIASLTSHGSLSVPRAQPWPPSFVTRRQDEPIWKVYPLFD